MREIKFRVWDKELKQMAYATTELFDNALSFWVMIHLDDDEPEWMQYTGLKDKNGKEIYEGDIVKYNYNNQVYQDVYAKVEYSIAGFRLNADYISRHLSRHIRIANTDYYEVVGNIYENPELLEVQND